MDQFVTKKFKLVRKTGYFDIIKGGKMENETLAMEILHELKASAKRWFIAFLTVLVLWFATIGVFIWYISLPVEEYTIEQEATDRSFNNIGGYINGGEAESDIPETGD